MWLNGMLRLMHSDINIESELIRRGTPFSIAIHLIDSRSKDCILT